MGGTELISALKAVLKSASYPTQVLLLTDGQVWRLDETLELIEKTRRDSRQPIRFFCLGIGDMISHALVEGLADSGGGYSDVIFSRTDVGRRSWCLCSHPFWPFTRSRPGSS